jgi:hypothetical protein
VSKKKRLKVGMLVQVINRRNSEVMPQIYVLVEALGEELWEISPVSNMSRVRYFHTKQLKVVLCK